MSASEDVGRAPAWQLILLGAAIAFLFWSMVGCAFMKSLRDSGLVAAGGAGGAVIGSTAGPVGTVAGAGLGAATVYSMQENANLKTGETLGREALERELERHGSDVIYVNRPTGWSLLWMRLGQACGALLAIKYGLPWLRSSKNFWGGIRCILSGNVAGGLRRAISGTGIIHTSASSKAAAKLS